MTLTKEWFMQSKEREDQRNENGVKLEHAIEDLRMINSPVAPYAWEMAEWIYRNWPLEKFLQLPPPEREIVMEFVDKKFSYPGVKTARQKRRLERKANEQAEKEARKNNHNPDEQPNVDDDIDLADETHASSAVCKPNKLSSVPNFIDIQHPPKTHYGQTYSKEKSLPPDRKPRDSDKT